ncbi:MAG TPA: methyltransferase domain-containing protein [Bryobacteraceae bacterium]|jgi:SAM-dependent methyltransferase|nr:methyltransferase domain-containing protein [Bryobacteraceae bacterium]
MSDDPTTRQLEQMRLDWDQRARENARYYVASGREQWTDEEYFRSGELNVEQEILNDMGNVCQGRDPRRMRVLEIGCGTGRITRALARQFGEVYAVDISAEMVRQAREALRAFPNARVFQNNGRDLTVLRRPGLAGVLDRIGLGRGLQFDFAFSYIVFQHIPSYEVIESYVREVHRLLRPGALFKFQVQGYTGDDEPRDSWLGVPFDEDRARAMAGRCGFEMRYNHGAGSQYYWLWFFKQP